ncbi:NADPH-dependent F420 reductase [Xanthocytophaga flava]|uniref:NADPH-dependent F420 reductase n=1 Tax=Xanthocytophaga flava TaxID=3048013 RepID=UPI0028D43F7A|nr:NAD(P)-binding domain-containing protein [Xanthocytophaga flavus]MDJ1466978.1 NAD(P)-binding domain-containing protein [Xanthocytophaga flavus]
MNIEIIGSGHVGGNFGLHLAKAGHQVMFSSRHPEQLADLVRQAGSNAQAGTIAQAADFGSLVVLSIPYGKIPEVAEQVGTFVHGKTLIDTCNPYPQRDGEIAERVRQNPDLRETQLTVDSFPMASVVKALNTIYFVNLRDYAFRPEGSRYALPIAGNRETAKKEVAELLHEIGFDVLDVGSIADSKVMEVDQLFYNKPMSLQEMQKAAGS